jgi:hypothetical protein
MLCRDVGLGLEWKNTSWRNEVPVFCRPMCTKTRLADSPVSMEPAQI